MGFRLRNVLPRGLYPRSILIAVVPVVLLLLASTFVFYDLHWRQTSRKMAQSVAGEIAMLVALKEEEALSNDELARLARDRMAIDARYTPGDALPPARPRSIFTALDDTLSQELSVRLSDPFWYDISGYATPIEIRVALDEGVMAFRVDRERTFSTTGHMFLFWVLGATIILIMLSLGFLRNQVRSILDLGEAAKAFGRGRDVKGFRPYGATEVREAARAVLDMRARLTAAAEQRTAMLAGVSHDLRTPLTRLKLQLAMMPQDEDVTGMRADLDDMEAMLEEYLAFARGEEGEANQTVDLDKLAREVANGEAPPRLTLADCPPVQVEGRPLALKRAMANLVENALAHADRVEVRLLDGPKAIDFIVDDDGPGIPAEMREAAFKPFFRFENGSPRPRKSAGLGLALSRDTARGHGGDITLETSPLGGLRARLRLPH